MGTTANCAPTLHPVMVRTEWGDLPLEADTVQVVDGPAAGGRSGALIVLYGLQGLVAGRPDPGGTGHGS